MNPATIVAAAASAPYALWMLCMFALPVLGVPAPVGYEIRTLISAVALAFFLLVSVRRFGNRALASRRLADALLPGLATGLLVAALWIAPEYSAFYREWLVLGDIPSPSAAPVSPYAPSSCGWWLYFMRLAGSAFVIAPAEEMFFRWFLYRRLQSQDWLSVPRSRFDLQAFLWTLALFTLEHDRIAAAAAAGAVYCFVYMRFGLSAAIIAHSTTNLTIAIYALLAPAWELL